MWQDYVFAIGSLFFIAALIPMFKSPPPVWTSGPTALILILFSICQFTLHLDFSCGVTFTTGLMWLFLFNKKIYENKTISTV